MRTRRLSRHCAVLAFGVCLFATRTAAQDTTGGIVVIDPSGAVTSAPDSVPQVPPAPALPKASGATVGVLDGLLLNGIVQRVRVNQALQAARAYQMRLVAFVGSLTSEQSAAVMADPQQREVFSKGLGYLQAMGGLAKAEADAAARRRSRFSTDSPDDFGQPSSADGRTVYAPGECIGAIVMDVCHGSILPNAGYHPVCHGETINGQCTGPMF